MIMQESQDKTVDFLADLPIFQHLTDEQLADLADIAEAYSFSRGSIIAYQRDVADSLYIVRDGRLFATAVDDQGVVRDSRSYFAGDYFDDRWLFTKETHPATVKGGSDGRLLIIPEEPFLQFLSKHPQALSYLKPVFDAEGNHSLGLTPEAWELAQKTRIRADRRSAAINLLPDELVEYQARRSYWFLLVQTVLPALGLLFLPLGLFIFLNNQPSESLWYGARWVASGLLFALFSGILLFQFVDWLNDYFVITNKHLAHREFNLLTFRNNIVKVPIDQIQSVEIDRPNFISNLLNFGTARITTAAAVGVVYFDNIDNPRRVQHTLTELRQRVQELDEGRAQSRMRRSVESHFQLRPNLEPIVDETAALPEPKSQRPSLWRTLRNMYSWRVETNGTITYRKHFLVLFSQIAWPLGFLLAVLFVDLLLIRFFGFTVADLMLISGFVLLLILGWLIWRVEDWRNDTFQVSSDYVVDIDRRPFGFGESRKQAPLNNVQNVSALRPNLWATVFRFGDVIVETAGATADITFENVSNPTRVQSDIFRKRDQFRARQRLQEGSQRRKEYAVLLDVYKQAVEQERIPRRTPADEDIPGYLEDSAGVE